MKRFIAVVRIQHFLSPLRESRITRMKPEMRIALLKEAAHAKDVLTEESVSQWTRYGFIGAIISSFCGTASLGFVVKSIADKETSVFLNTFLLFISIVFIAAPWYFIIRKQMSLKIQLLCEAILSMNDSDK